MKNWTFIKYFQAWPHATILLHWESIMKNIRKESKTLSKEMRDLVKSIEYYRETSDAVYVMADADDAIMQSGIEELVKKSIFKVTGKRRMVSCGCNKEIEIYRFMLEMKNGEISNIEKGAISLEDINKELGMLP